MAPWEDRVTTWQEGKARRLELTAEERRLLHQARQHKRNGDALARQDSLEAASPRSSLASSGRSGSTASSDAWFVSFLSGCQGVNPFAAIAAASFAAIMVAEEKRNSHEEPSKERVSSLLEDAAARFGSPAADPVMNCLAAQVSSLEQDRRELQWEALQLRRELRQLRQQLASSSGSDTESWRQRRVEEFVDALPEPSAAGDDEGSVPRSARRLSAASYVSWRSFPADE